MADWNPRANEIFLEALEIHSPQDRTAFVENACKGDSELRAEVESLLKLSDQAGSFLESPASALDVTSAQPTPEPVGTVIGPYKLLEQIGEGGMGVVYMADQQSPVRRRVALKVIKPGMDSGQVIARFEAERQALALMDHTNIARVLDAGATDSGRPYFVMELVRGVPITEYCDKNNLPVHERLELFVQVCQAVQHAHQKGIIHRDIKPSNVLVTQVDGRAVPKVIDFGVAKAIHQQLTDKTLFTNFAQMIGTPLYMSPEQAEMASQDVDTRSDIYSLGVLLYELLTGTTPFDQKRLREAAFDEIRRVIREEEPPKPSTRISTLGEARTVTAAHRKVDPNRLSQLLRGDLDWIVMKSIEKDRTRRYETASGLARDVDRYLSHQPVEACPPSAAYRFRKFARRNRIALATAFLVSAALVLGTVVSTWQAIRAEAARAAESQQRGEAEEQRALAEESYEKARKAVDDYFNTVSESKLLEATGLEPLRKELLESALKYYEGFVDQHGDDPGRKADLIVAHLRVAMILYSNGDGPDHWGPHLVQALEILEPLVHDGRDTPDIQRRMAGWYRSNIDPRNWRDGGTLDREAMDRLLKRYADIWEKFVRENPGEPEFQNDLAGIYFFLGSNQVQAGKIAESFPTAKRMLEIWEKLVHDYPDEPRYRLDLARVYETIGYVQRDFLGQQKEGQEYSQKALMLREQVVNDFPQVAGYRTQLGLGYRLLAESASGPDEEEELRRKALAQFEKVAAAFPTMQSPREDLAGEYQGLGHLLTGRGKHVDALKFCRQAVNLLTALVAESPEHWNDRFWLAVSLHRLANSLNANGQANEAEAAFRQSLELFQTLVKETPTNLRATIEGGWAARDLSGLLQSSNRIDEAVETLRQSVDLLEQAAKLARKEKVHQENARRVGLELGNLLLVQAKMLQSAGKLQEAVEFQKKMMADFARLEKDSPRNAAQLSHQLGDMYANSNQNEAAIASYRRAIELDSSDENAVPVRVKLIHLYIQQSKLADAIVEAKTLMRLDHHPDHAYVLALLLLSTGQIDEYRQLCQELLTRDQLTENLNAAIGIGICCKLGPDAVTDYAPILTLFDKAIEKNPGCRHIYAHLLFRSGQTSAAVKQLEEVIPSDKPESVAYPFNRLFLSMAKCRLGLRDEASELLNEAAEWIDKNGQEKLGEGASLTTPLAWPMRQELTLLRKEAEKRLADAPKDCARKVED